VSSIGDAGAPAKEIRRDAATNREKLLVTAAATMRERGTAVPMSEIAAAAGLGVGTLYRHFPDRNDLLQALEDRSYRIVVGHAEAAERHEGRGIDALGIFLELAIAERDDLVLPLLGGRPNSDAATVALRTRISEILERIFERGRADGSIRPDATSVDAIIHGAMLASPLANAPDWDRLARRQARVFLDGLTVAGDPPLPGRRPTRRELEESFARSEADGQAGGGA
jgi:AcrR family transcriptional regulator